MNSIEDRCLISELMGPTGVEKYVNNVFNVLEACQFYPTALADEHLEKNQLVCPLFATLYSISEDGKSVIIYGYKDTKNYI